MDGGFLFPPLQWRDLIESKFYLKEHAHYSDIVNEDNISMISSTWTTFSGMHVKSLNCRIFA